MTSFNPADFFSKSLVRNDWLRLTKAQLIKVAEFQDVQVDENLKKIELIDYIIKELGFGDSQTEDQKTKLEMAKLQTQLELAKIEEHGKLERARLEIEREKIRSSESHLQRKHEARFDVSRCLRLMPKFNHDDVDIFFEAFEKVASELEWPEDKWPILVQSAFVGKAQEAYAALNAVQSTDYVVIKEVVLRAYEVVPESHRQKFRSLRRKPGESFLDLVRQQEAAFERWLRSSETFTLTELKELVLLEQFKNSVPRHIELYLNGQNVTDCRKAAMCADSYELTQKDMGIRTKPAAVTRPPAEQYRPREVSEAVYRPPDTKFQRVSSKMSRPFSASREVVCHYCKKPGHIKSSCPVLERKSSLRQEKTVALVSYDSHVEHTRSTEGNDSAPDVFGSFVSSGSLSLTAGGEEVTVNILRDTGAAQSVVCEGVLDLPTCTSVNRSVLLKGLGGEFQAIPLHKLRLKSNLVTGVVVLGVVPSLPIEGVHVLLGNDLASDRVYGNPLVSDSPCESLETQALEAEYPEVFSSCVVTRGQAKAKAVEVMPSLGEPSVDLGDTVLGRVLGGLDDLKCNRDTLIMEQQNDPSLAQLLKTAVSVEELGEMAEGCYSRDGILLRKWRPPRRPASEHWSVLSQIVLPTQYREEVLKLAHEKPMAGHFGIRKTQERVLRHFYWPKVHADVVEFCRSCHACQVVGKPNQVIPTAPLKPLPVVEEPFSRVVVDCVGPLKKTKKGNEYLLTIMDVTSRFPEAVALRNIKARPVIEALVQFFSKFGLPREVQTDRGSNFSSGVFQEVMSELGIRQVLSSAYHPQSQGAIERCHQTLKTMIKTFCLQCDSDWDVAMPFLLFALRDAVNDSTGFSPFELVYGHEVRGPLKLMKEKFLEPEAAGNLLQYVAVFKDRLHSACEVACKNLEGSKEVMKHQYDRKAVVRSFSVGDQVLVLMPMRGEGLGTRFCGPYSIVKKVSDRNYVVETPDRRKPTQLCHINLLKRYYERSSPKAVCSVATPKQGAHVVPLERAPSPELESRGPVGARLQNSAALADLDRLVEHLLPCQQEDVKSLIHSHLPLFRDIPGLTSLVVHDVVTGDAPAIKQHPYRMHPAKLALVREEISYMLEIGVVEPSHSEWSSPIVLIPKPDGAARFCIDYRKINAVTKTDAFPIPRLEDCIDQIGKAKFVSKFDLLKGYWQVPLSDHAKEVSAFVTPYGLYQCRTLPFGMKNAPACFQRLMNQVTSGLTNVVTYIDDVVIFSDLWEDHVCHIRQLLERLDSAGLVVNLPKCELGKGQVMYLGHQVGQGSVSPRAAKIQAILDLPAPRTRRQLMRLLGMCGFYRKFVPNFASVTEPLTNLLRKGVKFAWSEGCQSALDKVKAILSCEPVLVAPDFQVPFRLAVDACDVGIGAVLLQADSSGVEKPVAYFSKKLNRHQAAYSTVEKEALGLVLAVQHFEVYLAGGVGDTVVYTDHNPLTFLAKFSGSNQRVFRWSLILQPYSLVIKHLPGKDNVIADTLSRV
ncbi:hypothetical protein ACEWY4_022270 [Coilia grayii]|uniref:Gypsy retrotransposon integrase-like protein 1 n=1 Tax=Coilia grayii TaxID=363190 RepID=A0ABD1J5M2_9TELE